MRVSYFLSFNVHKAHSRSYILIFKIIFEYLIDDFNKKLDKSVLWKHCRNKHSGQTEGIEFKMNVAGVYHRDPMKRQIAEAVRIQETTPNKLMNDKTEYNCIQLPRASVE